MPKLSLEHICKTFRNRSILDNVTIEVEAGELMVILGPSGSGKSTLLNVIAGLEAADAGTVCLNGRSIGHLEPKHRDMAMVFQNYALYPHKTVFGNLAFGLRMRRFSKSEIDGRVREVAEKLDITRLLDRKPRQLSGGERQRVAMGRALVRRPEIYLLDEPLSNLDAQLRSQIRTEVKKLHTDLNATMIFVTHDQIEAMTLADRIAVMDRGRIVQTGTPDDIYDRPVSTFVAAFIGSPGMNLIPAVADGEGDFLRLNGDIPFSLPDLRRSLPTDCVLGFRPEDLHPETGGGLPIRGRVALLEPTGSDIFALIDCSGFDVKCRFPKHRLTIGQEICLSVDFNNLHLFEAGSGKRITPSPF